MNADDVLNVLVESQQLLNCLGNDGRLHIADARLSVFRSDEHFAVFTEFPHFSYGGAEFLNWLGYAGSSLSGQVDVAIHYERNLIEIPSTEKGEDDPIWKDCFVNRSSFSATVSGRQFDFHPSNEDYSRAGIVFDREEKNPPTISPGHLLRFVSVVLDHPFFYSEGELRKFIDSSVEAEMCLFLQTSQWQHPVYLVTDDDPLFESDWIENIPCWQILSRAIASGDLREWNAQDTSGFNTDWASLERIYQENNTGYGFE